MDDNIILWEEDQVHDFLCSLGFASYGDQIRAEGITGEVLIHCNHEALKDLGIHSVGHRLAILKGVYQLKLQHDVPIEEGHWVPPSEFVDQIMVDSPAGVIPPDRMLELLRERDERIMNLEISIQRLQEHMTGVRDEVHVISKTLYTKDAPVSLNRLRGQPSPTQHSFPHPLSNSSLATTANGSLKHMRSSSLSLNGHSESSPHASPVNSPTRAKQEQEDSHYHSGGAPIASGSGLQHSSSIRRQKSNNTTLLNASASAGGISAQYDYASNPAPTSPLPSSVILNPQSAIEPPTPTGNHHQQMPTSSAGDTTPLPPLDGNYSSSTQGASSSTSASQIMNESMRPATAQVLSSSSSAGFAGMPNRPATATENTSSGHSKEDRPSTSSRTGSSSSSAIDNPYKSFRVTLDDPCYKVLPAALKKYKINDDWRQYALFICYGTNERCLSYDEKPLLLFQKLKDTNQNPVFMLRHIKDIKSPITVANAKHAARREKRVKDGKHITGEGKEGAIREFTRATRLHHPTVLMPVKGSTASPGLNSPKIGSGDADKGQDAKEGDDKETAGGASKEAAGAGYALAIYPYMADREDEFDVAVGDTFVILNKTKGWWVVHRDTKATEESDIVRSGWVPKGCLLETSVPPSSFASTPVSSSTPINPVSIVSVSTPGIALMDYSPRGSDEISMKKEDKLRVFKRYNHWSYVIKEGTGDRGWTPSWFVGKIASASSGGTVSQTSTPTSALATGVSATSSSMNPGSAGAITPSSAGSGYGLSTGETTPTSAIMKSSSSHDKM